MGEAILVMDEGDIGAAIERMVSGILTARERGSEIGEMGRLLLAGIPTRGVELARRLAERLEESAGVRPLCGAVDVSMHRDDLEQRHRLPAMACTELPFSVDGRPVILVDDVLFTGRSCRAALEALLSYGRPSRVELAVLVDRGHRELPIQPNYVGKVLATLREEKVVVRLAGIDEGPDSVHITRQPCF